MSKSEYSKELATLLKFLQSLAKKNNSDFVGPASSVYKKAETVILGKNDRNIAYMVRKLKIAGFVYAKKVGNEHRVMLSKPGKEFSGNSINITKEGVFVDDKKVSFKSYLRNIENLDDNRWLILKRIQEIAPENPYDWIDNLAEKLNLYAKELGINKKQLQYIIKTLVDQGFLLKRGVNMKAYRLTPEGHEQDIVVQEESNTSQLSKEIVQENNELKLQAEPLENEDFEKNIDLKSLEEKTVECDPLTQVKLRFTRIRLEIEELKKEIQKLKLSELIEIGPDLKRIIKELLEV